MVGILGSLNLIQAACVFGMSALLLHMHPAHAAGLAMTMVVAALTFMLIILLLVRVFGDAGKAVALILLIPLRSSAGGVTPIELTSFRATASCTEARETSGSSHTAGPSG